MTAIRMIREANSNRSLFFYPYRSVGGWCAKTIE